MFQPQSIILSPSLAALISNHVPQLFFTKDENNENKIKTHMETLMFPLSKLPEAIADMLGVAAISLATIAVLWLG